MLVCWTTEMDLLHIHVSNIFSGTDTLEICTEFDIKICILDPAWWGQWAELLVSGELHVCHPPPLSAATKFVVTRAVFIVLTEPKPTILSQTGFNFRFQKNVLIHEETEILLIKTC